MSDISTAVEGIQNDGSLTGGTSGFFSISIIPEHLPGRGEGSGLYHQLLSARSMCLCCIPPQSSSVWHACSGVVSFCFHSAITKTSNTNNKVVSSFVYYLFSFFFFLGGVMTCTPYPPPSPYSLFYSFPQYTTKGLWGLYILKVDLRAWIRLYIYRKRMEEKKKVESRPTFVDITQIHTHTR